MILKLIIQIYDIKSNQIGTSACNNNFYNRRVLFKDTTLP